MYNKYTKVRDGFTVKKVMFDAHSLSDLLRGMAEYLDENHEDVQSITIDCEINSDTEYDYWGAIDLGFDKVGEIV
jgi:hypothetical protein